MIYGLDFCLHSVTSNMCNVTEILNQVISHIDFLYFAIILILPPLRKTKLSFPFFNEGVFTTYNAIKSLIDCVYIS
jgi:hypothetical protein